MPQSLSNYVSNEFQAKVAISSVTGGTFAVGDKVRNHATLGSATAFGIIKEIAGSGSDIVLTIDNIGGVTISSTFYPSKVLFTDTATITNGTASATVDNLTGDDGCDLRLTTKGIERVKYVNRTNNGGASSSPVSEVVVALKDFSQRFDALKVFDTAPTFAGALTYTTDATLVTGEDITLTLTATGGTVSVSGAPTVAITINGTAKTMAYHVGSSTSTSLVFKYTAVAGDVATAGQVSLGTVVNGSVSQTSGTYSNPIGVSFAAVNTSAVTFN